MPKNNDYQILELDHPHGFLIWRGKQTAIGTPEALPVGEKLLIVSEDEAFGYVTLKSPAQMTTKEFDRETYQKEHRLYPTEWRLGWQDELPNITTMNLYRFESWEPFEKALPFENGEIITDEPTPHEAALIDKSRYLPKTLVLDDEAITMTGGKFTVADGLAIPDDLKQILSTTYETEVEFVGQKQTKYLPLYRLALVRVPNMRVKKNEGESIDDSGAEAASDGQVKVQQDTPAVTASVKQDEDEDMPWEKVRDHPDCPSDEPIAVVKTGTGEVEGCHANEEDANAQLAALNAAEEGESAMHPDRRRRRRQHKESNMDQDEKHYDEVAGPAFGGVTSFSELMEAEQAEISAENVHRLTGQFQMMIGNIMANPLIEDKQAAINELVGEFGALVNETMEENKQWQPLTDLTKRAIKRIFKRHDRKLEEDESGKMFDAPCGIVVKEVDGEPWHVLWSTNAFEDRELEIFSTEALKTYVRENAKNKDGERGTFDLWHMPGTDFADKKFQAVIGRILLEAGPYRKDETGQMALEFFKQYPKRHPKIAPEGWGASPAFRFLPEDRLDSIYDWLWITKTSTLPRAAAANVWTKATQENVMTEILPEMKELGEAIWGVEGFQKRIKEGEAETKRLEKYLAYKSKEDGKTNEVDTPEESEQETEAAQVEDEPEEEADITEEEETDDSESDGGEAVPVVNVDVEELATEVKKQFEMDLEPVAQAMAEILAEVKGLGDRVAKLEKQEAVKQQVETPRFSFSMIDRASQAEETALVEDDELKGKKPKETRPSSDGSVMSQIFPSPK